MALLPCFGVAELTPSELAQAAAAESAAGRFPGSAETWLKAAAGFGKAGDRERQVGALMRAAAALQIDGQVRLALQTLRAAEPLALPRQRPEVLVALGGAMIFGRQADQAEARLREGLKTARAQNDHTTEAIALNLLGLLLSGQDHWPEARAAYSKCLELTPDGLLAAEARLNFSRAASRANQSETAVKELRAALRSIERLPDSHQKVFLQVAGAQTCAHLAAERGGEELRRQGGAQLLAASALAEKIGDQRGLSYALGELGAAYAAEGREAQAAEFTRRALHLAQESRLPDALYRWQWQSGRLLARQGDLEGAIASYHNAVETLQPIRNDIAMRFGNLNAGSSFREVVGDLYFELADLLLQQARKVEGEARQVALREARNAAELLKVAELEDYFQDDCVNVLRSRTRKVEALSQTAAVIHVLPLRDRTELLVTLPSGELWNVRATVTARQLDATVRTLRLRLEDRLTHDYLAPAQQLHSWLIAPLLSQLREANIDTLVIVADGALRTVPLAALHDGERFLVEEFAIATAPGIELMETKPAAEVASLKVLATALSTGVQGYPSLHEVSRELAALRALVPQCQVLENAEFEPQRFAEQVRAEPFQIIHIASHGRISSDVRQSFLLTYDSRLTLDDLENCIRPAQLRDTPLDLLVLSACQTAAGDDRAALGLGGVAVKAGARSALATLWFVNDAASAELVSEFYTSRLGSEGMNKAKALQAAQRRLLAQPRYDHPCYWAPYLIIGNWL